MTAALVPPWLEPLLKAPFFTSCRLHGVSARSERNMFCLDCPSAAAFCFYCRSAHHSDHRTIQIRRSSYHDVVRVAEIQKELDVSGVQTYVINSARVIFLNERPQPKGGTAAAAAPGGGPSSGAAVGKGAGGVHICEICSRTLLDPFRFCSLGCKLERARRHGDARFQVEGNDDEESAKGPTTVPAEVGASGGEEKAMRWRRRGRAVAAAEEAAAESGGEVHGARFPSPPSATPTLTTPPTHGSRRRKGIPHRSPLASS